MPAGAEDELPERLEGARLERLRAERAQRLGVGLHSQQVEQTGGAGLAVEAHRGQSVAHLGGERLGRVAVLEPARRPHHVEEGKVRDGGAVRDAVGLEADAVRAERLTEFRDEPRLPDAGLAHDAHDLPVPAAGRRELALDQLELAGAADEARQPTAGLERRGLEADEAIGPAGQGRARPRPAADRSGARGTAPRPRSPRCCWARPGRRGRPSSAQALLLALERHLRGSARLPDHHLADVNGEPDVDGLALGRARAASPSGWPSPRARRGRGASSTGSSPNAATIPVAASSSSRPPNVPIFPTTRSSPA